MRLLRSEPRAYYPPGPKANIWRRYRCENCGFEARADWEAITHWAQAKPPKRGVAHNQEVPHASKQRRTEQTWEDALKRAARLVDEAQAERRRVFAAALDAGLSARVIAGVTGIPHSTVWRMAGGKRHGDRNHRSRELLRAPSEHST